MATGPRPAQSSGAQSSGTQSSGKPAGTSSGDLLRQTVLHDLHLELGARLVSFAGYEMPVQYSGGILAEHRHTRTLAGLFDVSHMGQIRIDGDGCAAALETLVPMDIIGLAPGRQRYAMFTNDAGGVLDDFMVIDAGDHLLLVVNAACKDADFDRLQCAIGGKCRITRLDDRTLLALQGPAAAAVLARHAPGIDAMAFMDWAALEVAGIPCTLSRSGYTGEDGFEISVASHQTLDLARLLLNEPEVAPVGLGARNTLRLEAGLCLYGQDLDETTTPVEAGLTWAIQKSRRTGGKRAGGFPGAGIILDQIEKGPSRHRVGLRPEGRAPVREGAALLDEDGQTIGTVTSGGFGASLQGPLAMGYVAAGHETPGQTLVARQKGRTAPVVVTKTPFVRLRYKRPTQ